MCGRRLRIVAVVAAFLAVASGPAYADLLVADGSADFGTEELYDVGGPFTGQPSANPDFGLPFQYERYWGDEWYVVGSAPAQQFDVELVLGRVVEETDGFGEGTGDWWLEFAMVSGVPPSGSPWGSTVFEYGDLFLDIGGPDYNRPTTLPNGEGHLYESNVGGLSGRWNTAVSIGTDGDTTLNTEHATDVYNGTGVWWTTPASGQFTLNAPYRINTASPNAVLAGSREAYYGHGNIGTNDGGSRYLLEVRLLLTDAELDLLRDTQNIAFHWTMECGNDIAWGNIPTDIPRPPEIPEPATLTLLGIGLVAGIVRRRFRSSK